MAVVTKYGTGYRDPTSRVEIDADKAEAHVKTIASMISITNGDSIASLFFVGRVPSNAIIDPRSTYIHAAVTGVTDFDLGFYHPNGGAVIDADALVDGDDISGAGIQTLIGHGTLTVANANKRAWELAGLTSDPGGFLDIVATLKAASTATVVVQFLIDFLRKI